MKQIVIHFFLICFLLIQIASAQHKFYKSEPFESYPLETDIEGNSIVLVFNKQLYFRSNISVDWEHITFDQSYQLRSGDILDDSTYIFGSSNSNLYSLNLYTHSITLLKKFSGGGNSINVIVSDPEYIVIQNDQTYYISEDRGVNWQLIPLEGIYDFMVFGEYYIINRSDIYTKDFIYVKSFESSNEVIISNEYAFFGENFQIINKMDTSLIISKHSVNDSEDGFINHLSILNDTLYSFNSFNIKVYHNGKIIVKRPSHNTHHEHYTYKSGFIRRVLTRLERFNLDQLHWETFKVYDDLFINKKSRALDMDYYNNDFYIVTHNKLYKTVDFEKYTVVLDTPHINFVNVHNDSTIFVGGYEIYRSTDSGSSFENILDENFFYKVASENFIFLATQNSHNIKILDKNNLQVSYVSPKFGLITSTGTFDGDTVMFSTVPPSIYWSSDGFESTSSTSFGESLSHAMRSFTQKNGKMYAIYNYFFGDTSEPKLYISEDFGLTWKHLPMNLNVTKIIALNDNLFYGLTNEGSLVKSNDGGFTWGFIPMTDEYGIYHQNFDFKYLNNRLFLIENEYNVLVEVDLDIQPIVYSDIIRDKYNCEPPSSNFYSLELTENTTAEWFLNGEHIGTGDSVYVTFNTNNRYYNLTAEITSLTGKVYLNEVIWGGHVARFPPTAELEMDDDRDHYCLGEVEVKIKNSSTYSGSGFKWISDASFTRSDSFLSGKLTFDTIKTYELQLIPENEWCYGYPISFQFNVVPKPDKDLLLKGELESCEELQLYHVKPNKFTKKEWQINSIVSDNFSDSLYYKWDYNDGLIQQISVREYNNCGSSDLTLKEITVKNSPDPEIIRRYDSLMTMDAMHYEWFLDSVAISNQQTIKVEDFGTYFVTIDVENGCSGTSEKVHISTVLALKDKIKDEFDFYPNPANNYIILDLDEITTINVYKINGQFMKQIPNISGNIIVNLTDLQNGSYLLHFQNINKNSIKKLLIQRR